MNLKKRGIIYICIFDILIKLFFFILFQPWNSEVNTKQVLSAKDSKEYHEIAINLIKHRNFNSHSQTRFESSQLRTPVYPFFVSLVYIIFGSKPYMVLLIQVFLDLLICHLVYKTVCLKFSWQVGLASALFYSLDPFMIVYSLSLFSDFLFTLSIIVSIYFLLSFEANKKRKSLILSAFFLGISILIRPVAFLLTFILPAYILFYEKKIFSKSALNFILVSLFTIAPWFIRNLLEFDKWALSTSGEYNLLILYTAPVVADRENISITEAYDKVLDEANTKILADGGNPNSLNDFQKTKYWNAVSKKYINQYPAIFLKQYCIGVFQSFWNLDTREIAEILHLNKRESSFNIKGRTDLNGMTKEFFVKKSKEEIILAILIFIYLLTSYFFCCSGVIFLYKNPVGKTHLLFTIFVLYFILITGSAGLVRFRVPSIPFISIFAGIGLYSFWRPYLLKRILLGGRLLENNQ